MLTTIVRTAQSTNLPIKEPLLAIQFKLVPTPMKSEEQSKTVIDAHHAQVDNLLILPEPHAIPQDQFVVAHRLSMKEQTNAEIAHINNLQTTETTNVLLHQHALVQANILELRKIAIDVDNANKDG